MRYVHVRASDIHRSLNALDFGQMAAQEMKVGEVGKK
jgi:hypothetical protein